jgi:hypothetical protein
MKQRNGGTTMFPEVKELGSLGCGGIEGHVTDLGNLPERTSPETHGQGE